ncbi:MAG: hypothetical protein AB7E55_24720 [Pigmentiphaga sp.]
MANKHRGEVSVHLAGKDLVLCFGINQIVDLEDRLGVDVNGIEVMLRNPSMKTIRAVLWAGLRKHHNLSIDEVGDLITPAEIPLAMSKAGEAIALAFPDGEGQSSNPQKGA